jgi:hypothetical protein
MHIIKKLTVSLLTAAFLAGPLTLLAGETNKPKAKPYPLDTCAVSGEKLGGMGDPYVFVHEGQEIKLCCKGCLKDFKKEPAKYLKKVAEAEKNKKK